VSDHFWLCEEQLRRIKSREELTELIGDLSSRENQPFWAVLGKEGRAEGWLSICDVYQSDGAFEIGSTWFAPLLQGYREAREAIFLLMCLGMDDFQYERLVWRCQALSGAKRRLIPRGYQPRFQT